MSLLFKLEEPPKERPAFVSLVPYPVSIDFYHIKATASDVDDAATLASAPAFPLWPLASPPFFFPSPAGTRGVPHNRQLVAKTTSPHFGQKRQKFRLAMTKPGVAAA